MLAVTIQVVEQRAKRAVRRDHTRAGSDEPGGRAASKQAVTKQVVEQRAKRADRRDHSREQAVTKQVVEQRAERADRPTHRRRAVTNQVVEQRAKRADRRDHSREQAGTNQVVEQREERAVRRDHARRRRPGKSYEQMFDQFLIRSNVCSTSTCVRSNVSSISGSRRTCQRSPIDIDQHTAGVATQPLGHTGRALPRKRLTDEHTHDCKPAGRT